MRKSAKNNNHMVQTIQRRVTSRNATHDNGNINNFWKGSRWFCREYLKTFCYFLQPELRKWLFGKLRLCPWKQIFDSGFYQRSCSFSIISKVSMGSLIILGTVVKESSVLNLPKVTLSQPHKQYYCFVKCDL